MKVLIVDDEKGPQETLENLLSELKQVQLLGKASSIDEAEKMIETLAPQLIFLDIEMPGGTGFELLERIQEINFDIIFTTAYDQYAIKAIRYSALDYLLKPIDPEELNKAVERFKLKEHDRELINSKFKTLLNNISGESSNQKIAIPDGEGLNFVKLNEIIHFESEGSYTNMYVVGQEKPTLISKPIGDYEEMLQNESFFRLHRSHLINLNHVKKYVKSDGGYVIMSNNSKAYISRRKRQEFIQLLSLL